MQKIIYTITRSNGIAEVTADDGNGHTGRWRVPGHTLRDLLNNLLTEFECAAVGLEQLGERG